MRTETRPCDHCGIPVTKTPRQSSQRRYWTCGKSCAGMLRVKAGKVAPTWQPNRFRGQRETRPCARCGEPVTRYVTEQNHDQPWKCSRQCAVQDLLALPRQRRGEDVPCVICGKAIYRQPGRRGRKYCSAECAHVGLIKPLIEKPCESCGKMLSLRPSEKAKRFCSWECTTAGKFKNTIDRMHNGRPVRVTADGYLLIWEPAFAPPSLRGWALEHRVVMSKTLGRALLETEEVDHIDGNRSNNDPSNLQVLDKAAHRKKTGADARKKRLTMRDRLAEYERRYGPLESD